MSQYQARYEAASIRGFLPWMPGTSAPLKPYVRGNLVELNTRIMAERTAGVRTPDSRAHGTANRYRKHLRDGEVPCVPCALAWEKQDRKRERTERLASR